MDHYEALELSPNAGAETVERVFRILVSRYHPDNLATGDRARFDAILEAHAVLRDPEQRARYDRTRGQTVTEASIAAELSAEDDEVGADDAMRDRIMALFYRRRRNHVRDPGIGDAELSALLDIPEDQIEFHIWFLKEKKWISREPDGSLAITIDGVERVSAEHQARTERRRITSQG